MSLCDDSSVRLQCVGDNMLQLTVTLTAHLSDLPTSDLPDLHDVGKQRQVQTNNTDTSKELVFVKLFLGFVLIWICFVRSVSE